MNIISFIIVLAFCGVSAFAGYRAGREETEQRFSAYIEKEEEAKKQVMHFVNLHGYTF